MLLCLVRNSVYGKLQCGFITYMIHPIFQRFNRLNRCTTAHASADRRQKRSLHWLHIVRAKDRSDCTHVAQGVGVGLAAEVASTTGASKGEGKVGQRHGHASAINDDQSPLLLLHVEFTEA
jgi:hypothetical protein